MTDRPDNRPEKPLGETVAEQASDIAEDARERATHRVESEAEAARDSAAEEVDKAARAADAAASEFDPDSMQAQAIEQIARRIDDIADTIRTTDIDRLARTVGDTAARHPALFVMGAALAGFAATRFLKARDPMSNARASDIYGDPWDEPRTRPAPVDPTDPMAAPGTL